MKYFVVFLFSLCSTVLFAQETEEISITGTVVDEFTLLPIANANVINLNNIKGSITKQNGKFEISAKTNDTLYVSFIGYQSIKVRVSADWIKNKEDFKIKIVERSNALDELIIHRYQLTGILEVDHKLLTINENRRYNISGLPYGYEANDGSKLASSILGSFSNPADALQNAFSRRGKEINKLKKIKEDDNVRNSLATKYDRETAVALLGLSIKEIQDILQRCEYSKTFIETATDLQIIDAIKGCYEDYRFVEKKK